MPMGHDDQSPEYAGHDHDDGPAAPLVPLEKPFVDGRGVIQPLVERMMKSAVLISSKQGALRANHYHKTDWHYCYVVEGCIEYFHRPTGATSEPERLLVRKGEMVFTPPMVDHAMQFPEDTIFLTLSRNARDHASYEEDVVRVELLKR
jgi:quercetin dioxygenase-like cupin family protein